MTLKKIAQELGVSTATVSNVLNKRGRVGAEQALRIERFAAEQGYRPSEHARALHGKALRVIGVCFPSMADGFCEEILQGAEQEARSLGYNVVVAVSGGDHQREQEAARRFEELRLCGSLDLPAASAAPRPKAQHDSLPRVLLYRQGRFRSHPGVFVDFEESWLTAMRRLRERGHRQVALVYRPNYGEIACKKLSSNFHKKVAENEMSIDICLESKEDLLAQVGKGVTAFLCESDEIAVNCCDRLLEAGLRIPDQISVVGFRDTPAARYYRPALSTLQVPSREIGARAVRQLIGLVQAGDDEEREALQKQKVFLPAKWIERQSSGKLSR